MVIALEWEVGYAFEKVDEENIESVALEVVVDLLG